jgi:hypothetical protein
MESRILFKKTFLQPPLKFKATIYNTCFTTNYFPTKWKVASTIMLSKKDKDLSTPLNYSPVSLLDSLAKLSEKKLYLGRFNSKFNNLIFIREGRYGFNKVTAQRTHCCDLNASPTGLTIAKRHSLSS